MNKLRRMIYSQGSGQWEDIGARTLTHFLETLEPGLRHRIIARDTENKDDVTGVLVEPGKTPRMVDHADWRAEWERQT